MKTETTYVYRFEEPKDTLLHNREPVEIGFESHKAAKDYLALLRDGATYSHVVIKVLK